MNVLVPFDLEGPSERAIEYAAEVFGHNPNANVQAVRFVTDSDTTVDDVVQQSVDKMTERHDTNFETKIVRIEGDADAPAHIADQILAYTKEHEIDAIVMGYHQKGLLQKVFEGSTSSRVLSKREVPVTLVP